jgi:hypothetical protein
LPKNVSKEDFFALLFSVFSLFFALLFALLLILLVVVLVGEGRDIGLGLGLDLDSESMTGSPSNPNPSLGGLELGLREGLREGSSSNLRTLLACCRKDDLILIADVTRAVGSWGVDKRVGAPVGANNPSSAGVTVVGAMKRGVRVRVRVEGVRVREDRRSEKMG